MEGCYGAHTTDVFSARGGPGINSVGISLAFLFPISLGDVDKLFDGYRNRKSELEGELSCMFKVNTGQTITNPRELNKTVRERVAQIKRYQQLHQYSNAADTIWEFKEAMGFTGNFKVVEDLRNQVS